MALHLVPAYGRDYKSGKAARADWESGKDFTVSDISSVYDGKPINKADAIEAGVREVNIRYKRLANVVVVKVG